MLKKETIWRHLLDQVLGKKEIRFTQKELASRFGVSLSTVFNALSVPRRIGAVQVGGRSFFMRDPEKMLYLWATQRNLRRDIVYTTHVDLPVFDLEAAQPPGIIFAAFSAYRFLYQDPPADYDKVYVYSNSLDIVKKRFPPASGYPNFFVLKMDKGLLHYGTITPPVQIFVDIWNLPEWYTKDFLSSLRLKLDL